MARSDWVELYEAGMAVDEISALFEEDAALVRKVLGADVVKEVEVHRGKAIAAQYGVNTEMPDFFEAVQDYSPAAYRTFQSLRKGEMLEGIPVDEIGRRRLGMMMEKVVGGMHWQQAANEVGLSPDYVQGMAELHEGLGAWLRECRHAIQMRAMSAALRSL